MIADIRKKFPEYKDLSGEKFLDMVHKKYYSDFSREEFLKKVGFVKKEVKPKTIDDIPMDELSKIKVSVQGIREKNGEIVTFKETALEAIKDVNKRIDTFSSMLEMLGA